jgi:replication factor C subunit 3/5
MRDMYLGDDQSDVEDLLDEINSEKEESDIEIEVENKTKKKDKNKNFKPQTDILTAHMEAMNLIDEFKQEEKEEKIYNCLPWVEEFRPKKLKDVIDHELITSTLKKLIKRKQFPHLLLSGPPGTGKTSTIMACARELYKDNYSMMVLDINASEERGIDVVRYKIKEFITTRGIFLNDDQPLFKLVILDEADAMTEDAQSMLVNIIEKYTLNARFCLMCNFIKKINPAIQSRCSLFKFTPLKREFVEKKILQISEKNNFNVSADGIETLIRISNGDMRKVINNLQATYMAFGNVTRENISKCICYPYVEDINNIKHMLENNDIKYCYKHIGDIIKYNGFSLMDIIHELFNKYLVEYTTDPLKFKYDIKKLIINLRNIESNLTMCQNENIQLSGMISSFKLM